MPVVSASGEEKESVTPRVSIIIAVGTPGAYIKECIEHCLRLDYPDFEIIALPNNPWVAPDSSVRVIPTGKVRPAEKRDAGVEAASGEIVAIIDDDAYPDPMWLKNAVVHFEDQSVAAVGGPGVTPPSDNILQKISGWIYESRMVSGGFVYRYRPGKMRDVDDYPTSSLILRRKDFLEAGGFDTGYWPGEDTILCLKLTHELKKRIVYDPDVLVYHHRREIFAGHLRQIKSYALHRGFFAKKFPETSLKISYFVPSVFSLFALMGWLSFWGPFWLYLAWTAVMNVYIILNVLFSLKSWNPFGVIGTVLGTFATHIVYGLWFIAGLLSSELSD